MVLLVVLCGNIPHKSEKNYQAFKSIYNILHEEEFVYDLVFSNFERFFLSTLYK